MQQTVTFKIPDSFEFQTLIAEIAKNFSIKLEPLANQRQIYYDTFDWRLYNNTIILIRQGNEYLLLSLPTEEIIQKLDWKSKRQPKFWWDFPDNYLKNELKKYLDVRALIPLFEIEKNVTSMRILNEDAKTVLRVYLERIFFADNKKKSNFVDTIKLMPLKGYGKEFIQFKNYLNRSGIKGESLDVYSLALQKASKTPGDYSSKLNITLTPNMTARRATKIILRYLLQVMKQNQAGIKDDIDTEFLHDFRVAMRRTRSALTQIKGILSKTKKVQFRDDFASLGKSTNRMRDLDVYLLKKFHYQQMLPENLRSGLDPLFDKLAEERTVEHKNLVKLLESDSYKKIIASWDSFLNADNENEKTKNSHKPIIALAKKFIYKKYDQVINLGSKINDGSPASKLHQLRIECKKLRYLLEFFSSLFPQEHISILIKQLKKLQDNLGDYNDLSIQQQNLKTYLVTITPENVDSLESAASVGGLISALYQRQQSVRKLFAQTFANFRNPTNAELYQKLFAD